MEVYEGCWGGVEGWLFGFGLVWFDLVWFWDKMEKQNACLFLGGWMVHWGVMMMSYVEDTLARLMRDSTGTTAQSGTEIQYSLLQLRSWAMWFCFYCLAMALMVLLSPAAICISRVLAVYLQCLAPSFRHANKMAWTQHSETGIV